MQTHFPNKIKYNSSSERPDNSAHNDKDKLFITNVHHSERAAEVTEQTHVAWKNTFRKYFEHKVQNCISSNRMKARNINQFI